MIKEAEDIHQSLQKEFSGAEKEYSVICIEGNVKAETVARMLSVLERGTMLNMNGCEEWNSFRSISKKICHYRTDMEDVYTFAVYSRYPTAFAYSLSKYFPDKLVIGATDWGDFRLDIYKDGRLAVPRKDYKMILRIYNADYETDEYVSLEYSIFSVPDNRLLYATSYDMVSASCLDNFKSYATRIEMEKD